MSVVLFAARIDGPCDDHLSVHTTFEGAVAALLQVARFLHNDRFGYVPLSLPANLTRDDVQAWGAHKLLREVEDTMTGSGWRARVDELVVDQVPALAATAQPV